MLSDLYANISACYSTYKGWEQYMKQKLCVLGGGNGGFAISADMALAGYKVTLYEDEAFAGNLKELMETKTITLTGASRNGDAKLEKITTDLKDATENADVIICSMPAFAQEVTARKLAKVVKAGQIVFLCPGSTGGALVYGRVFREEGVKGVKICEVQTLPYSTRKSGPTSSHIKILVKALYFAAFPAKDTDECYEIIHEMYPAVTKVKNVMETMLNNGNIVSHAPVMVLNAGRISAENTSYQHYKDGINREVCHVLDGINEECMQLCKAFDLPVTSNADRHYITGYTDSLAPNSYDSYHSSYSFMLAKGPTTLDHRYLTEDAPFSMVCLSSLANALGLRTPLMDSIAYLGGALMQTDYWKNGRTIKDLGLDGLTLPEMKEILENGYPE